MLSSFDEDSVNVYADLSLPVTDDDPDDERLAEAFDNEDLAPAEDAAPLEDGTATSVDKPVADEATDEESATEDVTSGEYPAPVTARPRQRKQSAVKPPTPEPEQDRLVDVSEPAPPRSRAKSRKTRASIPTWDEIVFGGPKPKESPEQPGH